MSPEVRDFADPLEGLEAQLTKLRGLIGIVPPLIEADRDRRWKEINSRPSDGEDGDTIEIFGEEASFGEEGGFAEFDRTIYESAIVFGWAIFHDFLVQELRQNFLNFDLSEYPALQFLADEDIRNWDRRFDRVNDRFRDFADVKLAEIDSWQVVLHAQALRNALVHNQGLYTRKYLKTNLVYRPTKEDRHGLEPSKDDDWLIDHEPIPLSLEITDKVITGLNTAAVEIRDAIESLGR